MDEDAEDRIVDELDPQLSAGGCVVDFHTCDFFPERWFDLVVVLRAQNAPLFDRLTSRGYSHQKREENLECEIMQVVLDDARESYDESIVVQLPSNTLEDMEANLAALQAWCAEWKAAAAAAGGGASAAASK